MQALKKFGLGILWAFLLPFIVVGVALVAVFGIPNFIIQFFIMIINFFRGKKLFPVFPEDQKAYQILQRAIDKKNGEMAQGEVPAPAPQQVFVQQNFYTNAPTPPGIPGAPTALPPGYQQVPPGYQQLPPGYQQVPPPAYTQIPPAQPPQPEPIPERPPLAELPPYDPKRVSSEPDTIEIDVDEGDDDND